MEQQTLHRAKLTRDDAMRTLKAHEAALRQAGITRLALFGSTVRGEARADSDVDLLVDYDDTAVRSLLDIAGLQALLSGLLGRTAEIADRRRLKPFLRERILAEAVEVFPRFGHRDRPPRPAAPCRRGDDQSGRRGREGVIVSEA